MPEGSTPGAAVASATETASQALTQQGAQRQLAIPGPPWRNTQQRSQSQPFAQSTSHWEPQPGFRAPQWRPNSPSSPNPRTPSPSPAYSPQRHFYYPLVNVNDRHMPGPREDSAPHFDGTPRALKWFLDEVEILGRQCHLSSRDHIVHTLRYLDPRDREIWEGVASNAGGDWATFKSKITAMYPGSGIRYTAVGLEILVKNQAAVPMIDLTQFGIYYRQFLTRANWLLAHDEISQRECSELFLEGLHIDFRNQVKTQLRLMDPLHSLREPWAISQIKEAATSLLEDCFEQVAVAYPIFAPHAAYPSYSTHPPPPSFTSCIPPAHPTHPTFTTQPPQPPQLIPAAPVPGETFDMSTINQSPASTDALINELNSGLEQNTVATLTQQTRPSHTRYRPGCRACSSLNHSIRFCPRVVEYIQQGRCIKDESNRICLPNGIFVSPYLVPGKDILEQVDNWHKSHPTGTANNTTASIF